MNSTKNPSLGVFARLIDPKLLTKVTTWFSLSAEIRKLFGQSDLNALFAQSAVLATLAKGSEAKPHRVVRRAAKRAVRRAARTKTRTEAKKSATKAAPVATTALSLKDAIKSVLGTRTLGVAEIMAALTRTGQSPTQSTNPRGYVNTVLSSHNDLFERVDRGVYRVRSSKSVATKTTNNGDLVARILSEIARTSNGLMASTLVLRTGAPIQRVKDALTGLANKGLVQEQKRSKQVYWLGKPQTTASSPS